MLVGIATALTQMIAVGGVALGVYTEIVQPTATAAYDKGTELYQEYIVGTEQCIFWQPYYSQMQDTIEQKVSQKYFLAMKTVV